MTRLETAQMLREHDNFIILTHRRPDGDTTGCAAGLCLGLRALGKSAWVLRNRQLTPKLAPFAEGLLTDTCPEDATVISVDIASLGLFSFDAEALHLEERYERHKATAHKYLLLRQQYDMRKWKRW